MEGENKQQKKRIYCAIYTRKSTTEGLDQDFTSLDAQREAAENYVSSQKHEGWVALQENTMMAALPEPTLSDLPFKNFSIPSEHKIDCVVVYKVDRLSRSLMDFAQLLQFFDKNNVTFVSVTQQFNTNTSMGRLTLNILLSFAQFEREIISERTRDKMGAARKRGKWLGGRSPYGYDRDKDGKKLLVNPAEAKVIREIFNLYNQDNSLLKVAKILNERGLKTREGLEKTGKKYGGHKFSTTTIQGIVKNVLYIGKVSYAKQIYDGEQEAIIDEDTFKRAQERLKQNRVERKVTKNTECTGLLSHLLHCKICGSYMFHTYTLKKGTHKYRYYVCTNAQKRGYSSCPTKSVNAQAIEDATINCLKTILSDRRNQRAANTETEALLSPIWDTLYPQEKRRILRVLIKEVDYDSKSKKIGIIISGSELRLEFDVDLKQVRTLNKWHKEVEIENEPKIRRQLILAYQLQKLFDKGKSTQKQAAQWLNMHEVRVNQAMNMLLLSPKIQEDIICAPTLKIASIPEYKLRPIINEADWQKQAQMWHALQKS